MSALKKYALVMSVVALTLVGVLVGVMLSNVANAQDRTVVIPSQSESKIGYYYANLSDSEREVYDSIEIGLRCFDESINIRGCKMNVFDVYKIYKMVKADNPELFYVSIYAECTPVSNDSFEAAAFVPTYTYTKEDAKAKLDEMYDITVSIVDSIPEGMSDEQKMNYISNWISSNCTYSDSNLTEIQDMDSVFFGKKSCCAGISKAFNFVCNEAGLSTVVIYGQSQGADHVWNAALVDNNVSYYDITWYNQTGQKSFLSMSASEPTDLYTEGYGLSVSTNPYFQN